jgi:methyltransferase (TIGR00027 family)
LIRDIADTALLTAAYRAKESARGDALFHDPLARRLAGARGARLAASLPREYGCSWPLATRTYLVDRFVTQNLREGLGIVINIAAGLDARPYRLPLPKSLLWVEIDLPEVIAYKDRMLDDTQPNCRVRRIALDLRDLMARRALFAEFGHRSRRVLVLTEGLLIYLTPREAGSLGRDLAAAGFTRWVLDLHSPAVLRAQQHNVGPELRQAGTPFRFAPRSGADFFWHAGWEPIETRSIIRAAMRLGRIPRWNWAAAVLAGANGLRATVCLLARKTCAIGGDWHAPAMSRALSAMR